MIFPSIEYPKKNFQNEIHCPWPFQVYSLFLFIKVVVTQEMMIFRRVEKISCLLDVTYVGKKCY